MLKASGPNSGTILVTGGTGFVGRHVVRALVSAGWHVRVLIRPSRVLEFTQSFPEVQVVSGDLLDDADTLRKACANIFTIIHSAALMANADWAPKAEYFRVNVEGTRRLLAAASANDVKHVIHISTVGVLGTPTKIPADESHPYGQDLSIYEWSKRESEKVVLEYIRTGRIRGTVLRLAQLYGPGMKYGWPQTARAIRNGTMRIAGSGNALLHLTHIADVVHAIILVLSHLERAQAEVFNVAGPQAVPMRDVFGILADLLGAPPPKHVPYSLVYSAAAILSVVPYKLKPGQLKFLDMHRVKFFSKDHVYDIAKAKNVLGFSPYIAAREGFRDWIMSGDLLTGCPK